MLPLKDINPVKGPTVVTFGLIGVNVLVWIFLQGGGGHSALVESICDWGFVPAALHMQELASWQSSLCPRPPLMPQASLVTSMFLHGGWFHIVGNMWFLYIFGNNVEDRLGWFRYLFLYTLSGIAAASLQMFFNPVSTVPMVGASGAIGGVMGAYILFFPRALVETFMFFGFFWRIIRIPAYFFLGYWFLIQMLGGSFDRLAGGGVAYWAHVGGFVMGFILAYFMDKRRS